MVTITLPTVGGDNNTWGTKVNAALTVLVNAINSGSTDPDLDLPTWTNAVRYASVQARLSSYEINASDFGVDGIAAHKQGDQLQNAITFCLGVGAALRLPAGTITMKTGGGSVKRITIDLSTTPNGSFKMYGAGVDATQLVWADDIGVGQYGINITNSGNTKCPEFSDFSLLGKNQGNVDPNGTNTPTSGGFGLRCPNRSKYTSIFSSGFWAGFCVNGDDTGSGSATNTDHSHFTHCDAEENVYGWYFIGNGRKARDYIFDRCFPSRNQVAGIGIAENGEITDATFKDCHWNSNPWAFFKEGATPSNTAFLGNIEFVRAKFEGPGNGFFWCEATDGSGDMTRLTGFLELHGIETNGQLTGGGAGPNDHGVGGNNHTWRPWTATSITRAGGTVTAVMSGAAPFPIAVGDCIVAYVSDNHTLNSSVGDGTTQINGGFIVKTYNAGTHTLTWEQAGAGSGPLAGSVGPCVAMRAGSFANSDLKLSVLGDPTTVGSHAEMDFNLDQIDDVTLTTFGQLAPKIRLNNAGANSRKSNCLWRRGTSEAFLIAANGTFAAGDQLEANGGGARKSTWNATSAKAAIPYVGTALQPGATTISTAGAGASQVTTLQFVFVARAGRNSTYSWSSNGAFGVGAHYTTDPGSDAVLCEDPANPGDVMACPFTAGTIYRVVGRSLAAGSGGFIDMVQREPHVVKV